MQLRLERDWVLILSHENEVGARGEKVGEKEKSERERDNVREKKYKPKYTKRRNEESERERDNVGEKI